MRIRKPNRATGIFKRFARRNEGSVATIFAVSLVPVLIAAGVGIDMTRATAGRSNLQDALDATALALAHMPVNTPQAEVDEKALTWLQANLKGDGISTPVITAQLTPGQITLDATAEVPTTLTAIAGYKIMPIKAHSTVQWGLGRAEVALVLDVTGSMSGVKLQRMKDAANDLVDSLSSSVTDPDALKISVVPFSIGVRLSSNSSQLNSYRNASWMRGVLPSAYGDDIFLQNNTNRFTMLSNMGQNWAGCVETRPAPYDVQDTAPSTGNAATLFVPYFAPDEPDKDAIVSHKSGKTTYYYSFPNDYLDDQSNGNNWKERQGNRNKYNKAPQRSGGPNAGCSMAPLQRLTSNMSTVKNRINGLNATGATNIPIGLMWGWHTLSPNLPFADGVAYSDADTKKFLVLLTDGDNVNSTTSNPNNSNYTTLGYIWQDRLPGAGANSSASARASALDQRMALLCSNIKNAGITVYAVRIDVSGTAPQALSGCASSTDKFYDIDSTGLSAAFQNIAGSIGQLRIAQ